jgi:hypothetical protein
MDVAIGIESNDPIHSSGGFRLSPSASSRSYPGLAVFVSCRYVHYCSRQDTTEDWPTGIVGD